MDKPDSFRVLRPEGLHPVERPYRLVHRGVVHHCRHPLLVERRPRRRCQRQRMSPAAARIPGLPDKLVQRVAHRGLLLPENLNFDNLHYVIEAIHE